MKKSRSIVFLFILSATLMLVSQQAQASSRKIDIIGKVYDGTTSEPLSLALVRIKATGFNDSATTDETGYYRIDDCPASIALDLYCRKTGYSGYGLTLPLLADFTSDNIVIIDIPMSSLVAADISYEPSSSYQGILIKDNAGNEMEYIPGLDPSKFELREDEEAEEGAAATGGHTGCSCCGE